MFHILVFVLLELISVEGMKFRSCFFTLFFCLWMFSLEKAMAPHSSSLAWRIPWTEEPGGLRSTGLQRVGHDRATSLMDVPLKGVEDFLSGTRTHRITSCDFMIFLVS